MFKGQGRLSGLTRFSCDHKERQIVPYRRISPAVATVSRFRHDEARKEKPLIRPERPVVGFRSGFGRGNGLHVLPGTKFDGQALRKNRGWCCFEETGALFNQNRWAQIYPQWFCFATVQSTECQWPFWLFTWGWCVTTSLRRPGLLLGASANAIKLAGWWCREDGAASEWWRPAN